MTPINPTGGEINKLPKHGGPNSFKEAWHGLRKRKETINRRNIQIRDLKLENEKIRKQLSALQAENERLKKEMDEQCRLLGKGGEREAKLISENERLAKEKDEQYQAFQKWKKEYFTENKRLREALERIAENDFDNWI